MKKSEIKRALDALKTVKIHSIEDKAFRNDLISDHIFLLGQQKAFESDIKDLETVHLGAFEEERREVAEIQQQMQGEPDPAKQRELAAKVNAHTELIKAIGEYNKAFYELGQQEIEVPKPITADAFIKGMEGQDYDLALVEAVFPMFATTN